MNKVLYIDQPHTIRADDADGENVIWEIDDDEGLDITIRDNEIDIIAREAALQAPHRVLKYTAGAACNSQQIDIHIKRAVTSDLNRMPQLASDPPMAAAELLPEPDAGSDATLPKPAGIPPAEPPPSSDDRPALPPTLSVPAGDRVRIPASDALPDAVSWSFADQTLNTHIRLSADGVWLDGLPAGFYSLYCRWPDGRQDEIVTQVYAKAAADSPETKPPSDPPPGPPAVSHTDPNTLPDTLSGADATPWPRIPGACAIQVCRQGQPVATHPVTPTASLLIGRQSRSRAAVDLDLGRYTTDVARISRNHLRVWRSHEHLMLKNIGSHRVRFNGREMVPEQVAVLGIGGQIEIGDLTLVVVEHAP